MLNKLSATSIAAFKACPQRYRLQYVEGLRQDKDTESQRVGTNWHALHEVYANHVGDADEKIAAALAHLNAAYENVPQWTDADAWALERAILWTCFTGYLWFWSADPVEFLASEIPFELPLHLPRTGLPLPTTEVVRVGKIDHIIGWHQALCVLERKSTSRSIAPDSEYWDRSKKDTQVSMYALAFRDLVASGAIEVPKNLQRFGNTLYDVWHKPTIKPCMLTQAETNTLIVTGVYCGQPFRATSDGSEINGVKTLVEQGKKGFAIKETVEMFAARLLQDIYARPDHYFARREIARTDQEVREFRKELFAIYQAQKAYSKHDCWFSNESACRATSTCAFVPICYGPGADAVCDGKTTPPGFARRVVDLTINGVEPE